MTYKSIVQKLSRIRPDIFFLTVSLIAGMTFLILTPPFQVPDEINHFYKAYQISDGHLNSKNVNSRLGGYVPESFVKTTKPFLGLRWNMNSKTGFKVIREQFSIPLNEADQVFVDFPNTALYSPVSYIPQALSIYILKNLKVAPMYIFYGARIFTLFVWIICIWLAIRITPVYKWLFVVLALLPMSIYTNMSLSADVVTNISAFLLIAYFLKIAFGDNEFRLYDFLTIVLLTVLLTSAKIVYAPIILLFLIIPMSKFKHQRTFYIYFSTLMIIGLGTAMFWSNMISHLYIPYSLYNPDYRDGIDLVKCANIQDQLDFILHHGTYIVDVFLSSLYHTFDMYYRGYIGTFGWLDTDLPWWLINLAYLGILVIAVFENNGQKNFSIFQRLVLFGSAVTIVALVLLSQHLTWDCVGGQMIATIQGRYFIPVFPLLFMLFNNGKYRKQLFTSGIVILLSVILLFFSIRTLFLRYYITPEFGSVKIECDAEEVTSDHLFKTSNPDIFLENGDRQSDAYSRTGQYSVALSSEKPYGFTYRFYDGGKGDVIKIEVWRFGDTGEVVLSGESGEAFFITSSKVVATDVNGWDKLVLGYTLRQNMEGKEIGIYLYNPGKDTNFFDDLSISIDKVQ